jgi:hypothetical protein
MQTNLELELADEYVQQTGEHVFLTGKAGTGKTTFLHRLREQSTKRMVVVAPTGVAAINARGVTIHSFFQLPFGPLLGDDGLRREQMRFTKEKINIIRSLDLLVIDEISMVRADLLDGVDAALRRFRTPNKPFGGVQLLMIGDLQQLAPVVKDDERRFLQAHYDTPYFFSSKALRETSFVSIELTQVFRQQDAGFLSLLNRVRENRLDAETLEALNARYIPHFQPKESEGYITLCTHNQQAQRINEAKLDALPGETHRFQATVEGNFPEYAFPTDADLSLKEEAQVMFVKNDPSPEKLFYNGKIGKIIRIDADETIQVLCPGEAYPIAVHPLKWENVRYSLNEETHRIEEEVEGSFTQYPLKAAWAITIHKSQGLTFERAIIDAQASFAHGQVYVALSRCKTLEGMVLSTPIQPRSVISDRTVGGFTEDIAKNQPGQAHLQSAKVAYKQELLFDLFRFTVFRNRILYIEKIINENRGSVPEPVQDLFRVMLSPVQEEIIEVADRFHGQMRRLLQQAPDVALNDALQSRIASATGYFVEKMKTHILHQLPETPLDIDNKTVRKQLNDAIGRLESDARIKQESLAACSSGFCLTALLKARAEASIEKAKAKERRKAEPKESRVTLAGHTEHQALFQRLRAWRMVKATEMNVPAFSVFTQRTLYELVRIQPTDEGALKRVHGIGAKRIEQFGAEVIEMIREYVAEQAGKD